MRRPAIVVWYRRVTKGTADIPTKVESTERWLQAVVGVGANHPLFAPVLRVAAV